MERLHLIGAQYPVIIRVVGHRIDSCELVHTEAERCCPMHIHHIVDIISSECGNAHFDALREADECAEFAIEGNIDGVEGRLFRT